MDAACVVSNCGCGTAHDPSCPFASAPFWTPGPTLPVTPVTPYEPYTPVAPLTVGPTWTFTVPTPTAEERARDLAERVDRPMILTADGGEWYVHLGLACVTAPTLEAAFEQLLAELLLLGAAAG